MSALITERPDYAERVSEYLAKNGRRRLPWGTIVMSHGLTYTRSTREIHARHEAGETAIALLSGLGVTEETIERLADLPWRSSPAELVAALEAMRAEGRPGAAAPVRAEGTESDATRP